MALPGYVAVDRLFRGLRGFEVETPDDVLNLVDEALRGFEVWSAPAQDNAQGLRMSRAQAVAEVAVNDVPRFEKLADLVTWLSGRLGERQVIERPSVGEIVLDERGIKNSASHGLGPAKKAAFLALAEVIRSGEIIGRSMDKAGKPIENIFIVAPVNIDGETYAVAARIRKDGNGPRFYVHELRAEKELRNPSTGTSSKGSDHGGFEAVWNVLQNRAAVNEPVFVMSAGQASERGIAAVTAAQANMPGLPVLIHPTASAITDDNVRRAVQAEGNVEAFFDPSTGTINILADRVASPADAERLIRHEGMHWAFAGPLRAEYEALLADVAALIPADRLRELAKSYGSQSPDVWLEEYLAYLGQTNPESKIWRRFVYEVKRLLRRVFGERVSFSDADVLEFLAKANRVLERGETPSSPSGMRFSKPEAVRIAIDGLSSNVKEARQQIRNFIQQNLQGRELTLGTTDKKVRFTAETRSESVSKARRVEQMAPMREADKIVGSAEFWKQEKPNKTAKPGTKEFWFFRVPVEVNGSIYDSHFTVRVPESYPEKVGVFYEFSLGTEMEPDADMGSANASPSFVDSKDNKPEQGRNVNPKLRYSKPVPGERMAERALEEGPLRVFAADGKDAFATVKLAGLKDIRILEMPEMLTLARALTGSTPELRKMRSALGTFTPKGDGVIRLDPRIFQDSSVAAKVFAHEIGHLADWLAGTPAERTMKRGNIIGRLYTLKKHMQATAFGAVTGVSNAKLREELVALTRYWRPWDEATSPKWYNDYRRSSVELYADAVSVLFNSPATLKQMAPTFYKEFFAWLDKKPEVKRNFFELQAMLHRPMMEVLQARARKTRAMFGAAEEVFLRARERARQWKLTPQGWWDSFKEHLYDRFDPVIRRQRKAEAQGKVIKPELRVDWLLNEHPLADNLTYTWLSRVWRRVVKPLEAEELSLEDMGEYLFFRRVMADRAGLANPGGHTPKTAQLALLRMRLDLGMRKFTLLEQAAERWHDYVFATVKEATQAGLISRETFETVIKPNRRTYAAFRPIEYVDQYVPAGVLQQVGTMKDIENPWMTTVLKVIAMRRAIQYQKAKVGTVAFLQEYFSDEIAPAQMRWDGKGMVPLAPRDREKGLLEIREDGKRRAYEVPGEIARMFDQVNPAELNAAIRVLDFVFRKGFYQLWVRFNPVFQLAYSPIRDAGRFYVNMPKAKAMKLAAEYMKAMPIALRRLRGEDDPIITDMYENLAMATPHDSFARNATGDGAFDEILRQFHLKPEQERGKWRQNALVKPVMGMLRGIELAGQIFEAAPKIAAYKVLTQELGVERREAGAYVRNYIGVPNYLRKGRHATVTGAILPFWNVAIQGMAADAALLLGKEGKGSRGRKAAVTSASWLFRFALVSGFYAVFQALARSGALGEDLEELFGGVSDYDSQNFMVIPLGQVAGGDFGRKTLYLRVPQDEMHRLMSGLLKAFIDSTVHLMKEDPGKGYGDSLKELVGFTAGTLPGVNPAVGIAWKWQQYAQGLNPYDDFRGSLVLSNAEHLAGGPAALKAMLAMTWNDAGLGNFYRYNPEADTTTEAVVSRTPLIQRLVKVSDRGYAERQQAAIDKEAAGRARIRLAMPRNVQKLATEHNFLRSLGKSRTPEQQERYESLKQWNKAIYQPAYEAAQIREEFGMKQDFTDLDEASEPWE